MVILIGYTHFLKPARILNCHWEREIMYELLNWKLIYIK